MSLFFLEHTEVIDQQPAYGNAIKPAGKTTYLPIRLFLRNGEGNMG